MVLESFIPGVSNDICTDLRRIFSHFDSIETVLLFGSRAKKTYKNGSDIDLAVCASHMSAAEFIQLWNQIDSLPIIFKIDLLHWNKLSNPALKAKITTEGQIFYAGHIV
jgi:predicted nucleotidyltransferase